MTNEEKTESENKDDQINETSYEDELMPDTSEYEGEWESYSSSWI